MHNLGKGVAFYTTNFLSVMILCIVFVSQPAEAKNKVDSIQGLGWLPLLSANINKLQPDINCPQNTVNGLYVDKTQQQITSNITEINWDFDCSSRHDEEPSSDVMQSSVEKTEQIDAVFKQLSELPDFKLQLSTLNFVSTFIKSNFSASLSINKMMSKMNVLANSDLLDTLLLVDFKNNLLKLELTVNLSKLAQYVELPNIFAGQLNNDLSVHYTSSIKQWYKGYFKVDWAGELPQFSEQVSLSFEGNVNLLTSDMQISHLSFNALQIEIPVSANQSTKIAYFKLKNSAPVSVNYASLAIQSFPLILRVGSSHLLTRVERGKSKRIRIDKQKLPAVILQLNLQGNQENLLVDWVISLLNQTVNGHLAINKGVVDLTITNNKINFQKLITAASGYSDALTSVEIDSGEVTVDLSTQFSVKGEVTNFKSTISSDAISGKKGDMLFDGVKIYSAMHYHSDAKQNIIMTKDVQWLEIKNLFVGIPIQALRIDARYHAGLVVIDHFKARLLGGRLDFDDLQLNAPSQTIINVSGLSLPEVVKYSAYPEIETQGILDGMLPLTLTDNGVEITDGIIFARSPGGYIKVPENTVIKAMGRGNPVFSFTMQLLSNFQFDTMNGRLGYTDDGESELKVEINGLSPEVSGTQPINFNYSHNENILKLLQSLRFNEQLVRDIQERY